MENMKKTYYIESGAMREAVQAETPEDAFLGAFMRAVEKEPPVLGMLTRCSTRGFFDSKLNRLYDDDFFIETKVMLQKTGLLKNFTQKDINVDEIKPCEGEL